MWVHHTHDASLWPSQGIGMKNNVARERGDAADDYFCLRWTENAEHGMPSMFASPAGRATNTWLVDPTPIIEQGLVDLASWVEDGVRPTETSFEYKDGKVTLSPSARDRGGIQPVVEVTANGAARAEVAIGQEVHRMGEDLASSQVSHAQCASGNGWKYFSYSTGLPWSQGW